MIAICEAKSNQTNDRLKENARRGSAARERGAKSRKKHEVIITNGLFVSSLTRERNGEIYCESVLSGCINVYIDAYHM